ncbi:MAG: bile acid:sodium symporter [Lentisphaeria bacterium]|nr:bile acid:sodium symporter [Lentisphaeria bacterium]
MFKKLYLPVGMIVMLIIALIDARTGLWIKQCKLSNVFIILIFLVCGWQTSMEGMKFDRKFAFLFVSGAVMSLAVSPWIGMGIARLLQLPELPVVGLVVISAVPPTLSSGIVLTETAEGNTFLSMMLTIGYNLLGVFTLPVMLSWILASSGSVDTNPVKMLIDLALLVVLPFFVGFLGKKLTKWKLPKIFGYVPSTCVLLLLLSFFATSSDKLKNYPPKILLLAACGGLLMHALLLTVMWFGGRALRYQAFDCKALIFTGASKTVTLALATLAIIGAATGEAVVPCLVYYFLQMMVDSVIAAKMGYSARKKGDQAAAGA